MKLKGEKKQLKKLEQFIWQLSVQFDLTYAALLLASHLLWFPSLDYFSFFCLKSFDSWVVALCKEKKRKFQNFLWKKQKELQKEPKINLHWSQYKSKG